MPERNEGLPLVETSRVPQCSYHTTVDQERAPPHTKKEDKPSVVITLAVINRAKEKESERKGLHTSLIQ